MSKVCVYEYININSTTKLWLITLFTVGTQILKIRILNEYYVKKNMNNKILYIH